MTGQPGTVAARSIHPDPHIQPRDSIQATSWTSNAGRPESSWPTRIFEYLEIFHNRQTTPHRTGIRTPIEYDRLPAAASNQPRQSHTRATQQGKGGWIAIILPFASESVALDLEDDDFCVVDQAVDHGCDECEPG